MCAHVTVQVCKCRSMDVVRGLPPGSHSMDMVRGLPSGSHSMDTVRGLPPGVSFLLLSWVLRINLRLLGTPAGHWLYLLPAASTSTVHLVTLASEGQQLPALAVSGGARLLFRSSVDLETTAL